MTLSLIETASYHSVQRPARNGGGGTPAGPGDIHLAATLHFDSLDALKAGMASPEGRVAGEDPANFAEGGADLHLFDAKEV